MVPETWLPCLSLSLLSAPVVLKAGDSIYFDSEMGHAYLKASDARCRVLATCAPRSSGTPDGFSQHFIDVSKRLQEPAPAPKAPPPTLSPPSALPVPPALRHCP